MSSVSIRTPATTANLGPGFDCVGVALELYNTLHASWNGVCCRRGLPPAQFAAELQAEAQVEINGEGQTELANGEMGLFFRSLGKILTAVGRKGYFPRDLSLRFDNSIPLARGLGSSAACIISALSLGREILLRAGQEADESLLLSLAVELDGYPDNVLPSLLGGARLNIVRREGLPLSRLLPIPRELDFVLAVPDFRIQTSAARQVLPRSVPLHAAVQNSARLAGLVAAFYERDFSNLAELVQSPLHIPCRSRLIPGFARLEQAAYRTGALAFTISGAGPAVLALALKDAEKIGSALVKAFEQEGVGAAYFISKVEESGTAVKSH